MYKWENGAWSLDKFTPTSSTDEVVITPTKGIDSDKLANHMEDVFEKCSSATQEYYVNSDSGQVAENDTDANGGNVTVVFSKSNGKSYTTGIVTVKFVFESNDWNIDSVEEASDMKVVDNSRLPIIGTWTGDVNSTSASWGGANCYGAQAQPMTLTVKSVSNAGQLTADASVIFHGHKGIDAANGDASSTEGDASENLTDLIATYSDNGFTLKKVLNTVGNNDDTIEIEVDPKIDNGVMTLKVTVTSRYMTSGWGNATTDTYVLTKQTASGSTTSASTTTSTSSTSAS